MAKIQLGSSPTADCSKTQGASPGPGKKSVGMKGKENALCSSSNSSSSDSNNSSHGAVCTRNTRTRTISQRDSGEKTLGKPCDWRHRCASGWRSRLRITWLILSYRIVGLHGCFNFCVILQFGGIASPWCDAFGVIHGAFHVPQILQIL